MNDEEETSQTFGPRPFTMKPDPSQVIEVTVDYIRSLDRDQLAEFLVNGLGMAVKPNATKSELFSQVMRLAMSATNY